MTLDRNKVREVLWPLWDSAQMDDGEVGAMLDALETCVRPARQQTIDRNALIDAKLASHVFVDTDGYRSTAIHSNEEAADRVLALLRPVDGVTLTREDISVGHAAIERWIGECRPSNSGDYLRQVRDHFEAAL